MDEPESDLEMASPAAAEVTAHTEDPDVRNAKILDLPMRLTVCVGGARISVKELLDITPETVIALDSRIDDPAELYIGERLVARGELVELVDDQTGIGVKLTEICNAPNGA